MPARTTLIFDLETVPDPAVYAHSASSERAFPPPYAHQPVAIGALWLDENCALKQLGLMGEHADERAMLEELGAFVAEQQPLLVSYNGSGFDLPVIWLRALHHGIAAPWLEELALAERHLDLCQLLAQRGAIRPISLDKAAHLIGLPGKLGVDGSQVETLYRDGKIEEIRRYCLSDVVQTGFLLLRCWLLLGQLSPGRYRHVATALLEDLQADERVTDLLAKIDRARLLEVG